MPEKILHHRGFSMGAKKLLSPRVLQLVRPLANRLVSFFPFSLKYKLAAKFKSRKYPYALVRAEDIVVQVGAPRDLLHSGRSRAVLFSKLATKGKVIVVEPDPENCAAIQNLISTQGLQDRLQLVAMGAWSKNTNLQFLSSSDHPAANLLKDVKEIDPQIMEERRYSVIEVPVAPLDEILKDLGIALQSVRVISITVNGAEPEILKGMNEALSAGLEFIALAETDIGYPELMDGLGFEVLAIDDRGFTFRRRPA